MRFYRALLHLYPASFRNEYGEELCALFARRLRNAPSLLVTLAVWIDTVFDTFINAVAAHWDFLQQDIRYAIRTLNRTRGFAITTILVAGLGIGANTAVFTIADHVLIRPLPFPESGRLVKLWEDRPGYSQMELSPPNYRDWKAMSTAFESMGAYHPLSANLVGLGEPQRLDGTAITASLLPALDVRPALGRFFTAEDDAAGAPATLMLSYSLWQTNFAADPDIVGKTALLDNTRHTIIGVMPEGFHFPNNLTRIWTPMQLGPDDFADRNNNSLHAIARLKPGVSLAQARQEMSLIAARLEQAFPKENERTGATVTSLRDDISARSRLLLGVLVGGAACLLVLACTNLANLLLARAMSRQKELAVRTSLGAGRERLVRQLLTESLLLALLGGTFGLWVAATALPLLMKLVPQSLPAAEPAMDLRVLLFTLLLTAITGLAFGVLPALRASRAGAAAGLREGSRGGVGGRKEALRSALVIVEVTVSIVLLVSAGLLIRALSRLQTTDPGFRSEGVMTLQTSLPMPKYEAVDRRAQFYSRVLSEVQQLPATSSAAFISFLPMTLRGGIWPVGIGGRTENRAEGNTASLRFVTSGFFKTLDIPLLRGRDISESDNADAPLVAVVSESFVRRYWPDQDPLGRRFNFAFEERTVIGVVGNVRVRGLERTSEPQVYLPHRQVADSGLVFYAPRDLVIRSSANPAVLLPAVRRIIRDADPQQPISEVRPLSDIVAEDTAPRLVQVRVLGTFAALAFLLAAVGIHGLLSFTVAQRTQEFGVRMALGAQPNRILAMVLRESFLRAAAGTALGVVLGYAAGRSLEALLVGVNPGDAPTFAAAIALAMLMTVAGSFLPALRAVRVNPTTAIRAE